MKAQINIRASDLTAHQLARLVQWWGTSQTETLALVVDRAYREEIAKLFTHSDYLTLHKFDKDQADKPAPLEPGDAVKNAEKRLFQAFEAQAPKPENVPQGWWDSEKSRWESDAPDRKWWNGIKQDLDLES